MTAVPPAYWSKYKFPAACCVTYAPGQQVQEVQGVQEGTLTSVLSSVQMISCKPGPKVQGGMSGSIDRGRSY